MKHGRVCLEVENGVGEVRLTRADKANALDRMMFEDLVSTGEYLAGRRDVRAIVISGEGQGFCAGADKDIIVAMQTGTTAGVTDLVERTHGLCNLFQYSSWVWRELPMPVIAAVHGFALGGGFQIALGADMRHMTADARCSLMEVKWGLVPDVCGMQLMRYLTRDDLARELCYTGRVFRGSEALAMGLATRISEDPRQSALDLAHQIAAHSPDAVRAIKRVLNQPTASDPRGGLLAECVAQQALVGSRNQMETVIANREHRAPQFID